MGALCLYKALTKEDQRGLIMAFILLTAGFALGRLLGLFMDGGGVSQTYKELGFEGIWILVGLILWRRAGAVSE